MGLSAKELMKIGLRSYKESTPVNWHGKIINVKYLLPLGDEITLIRNIVDCCYDSDNDVLLPSLIDMSFKSNIILAYSDVQLPDNTEDRHKLLYASDIYNVIESSVCKSQIEFVKKMIDWVMVSRK